MRLKVVFHLSRPHLVFFVLSALLYPSPDSSRFLRPPPESSGLIRSTISSVLFQPPLSPASNGFSGLLCLSPASFVFLRPLPASPGPLWPPPIFFSFLRPPPSFSTLFRISPSFFSLHHHSQAFSYFLRSHLAIFALLQPPLSFSALLYPSATSSRFLPPLQTSVFLRPPLDHPVVSSVLRPPLPISDFLFSPDSVLLRSPPFLSRLLSLSPTSTVLLQPLLLDSCGSLRLSISTVFLKPSPAFFPGLILPSWSSFPILLQLPYAFFGLLQSSGLVH